MDKVKSLTIALVIVVIAAIALVGVSYSRQKNAENRTLALVNVIKSATNLEQLQKSADSFVAYSGSGTSADASVADPLCASGQRATHGDDAGVCTGGYFEDNNSWWGSLTGGNWIW